MLENTGYKKKLCFIVVCDASYNCDDKSVSGEIIMLGNKETTDASPIYWKSGVIRKVCMSPKAAETRGVMKIVDDAMNFAEQLKILMNARIGVKIYTDSRPLLETMGSTTQVAKKALRQLVAYLKQCFDH